VLDANLGRDVVLGALVLSSAMSVLLLWVGLARAGLMSEEAASAGVPLMLPSPFFLAIMQGTITVLSAAAIAFFGARLGGKGDFASVLVVMVWLQIVLVVVQIVQTFVAIILMPLAGLIGLASIGIFFWLLTNFVAEVHGFRSIGRVFVGLVLGAFAMAFGLVIVFGVIGALLAGG
jgi:hypothetical protein